MAEKKYKYIGTDNRYSSKQSFTAVDFNKDNLTVKAVDGSSSFIMHKNTFKKLFAEK